MQLFLFKNKFDPIMKLKLKEKGDKTIPVIFMLKEPLSKALRNSIAKNRGKIKYEYNYMNAASADLTPEGADRLSEHPEVAFICFDRKAAVCMDTVSQCIGLKRADPYPLTGRGVNIALIDTGSYPHSDLIRPYRALLMFKDYVNQLPEPYDDNGHGTFMCGVIAGSGAMSESGYTGIAAGAKLIMLKAFNSVGEGSFSHILAAIGWVIENREKFKIKVLCLPFGAEAIVPWSSDPLCRACEAAWKAGIVVIAPSGNKGPAYDTITTPGIGPSIITVGCCEIGDRNTRKCSIADFSGRGSRREKSPKPDFTAPGIGVTSLASDKDYFPGKGRQRNEPANLKSPYTLMSGTSVASAVAAGCSALMLEKSPNLSPNDLKGMLKLSCRSLNELKAVQGEGVIDMQKLLEE